MKRRLDHRRYGDAWFLKPIEWEERYHKEHSKKTLKQGMQKRRTTQEKFSTTGTSDSKQTKKLPAGI